MINLVNIKQKPTPSFDLYIGRANQWLDLSESKWSNPFHLKREGDRLMILKQYLEYILQRDDLLIQLSELDGLTLGCYCSPRLCHGNILIELRLLQQSGQLIIENNTGIIISLDGLDDKSVLRLCYGKAA